MSRRRRVTAVAALALTRPVEFVERVTQRSVPSPAPVRPLIPTVTQPTDAVHSALGVETCDVDADFARASESVFGTLGQRHMHDGGLVLARVLYELVRHLQPDAVVETGVARGVSSAFVLTAMQENARGHLWSSDLPPLSGDWNDQSGSAVAPALRARWSYVRGTSKRALPRILREAGQVQLFVHDSAHSYQNMTFEFGAAWPRLSPGGFLVSDDVDDNDAFLDFADAVGCAPLLLGERGKRGMVGLLRKPAEA